METIATTDVIPRVAVRNGMQEVADEALQELLRLNDYFKNMLEYSVKIDESFSNISTSIEKFGTEVINELDNNRRSYFKNNKEADDAVGAATLLTGAAMLAVRGAGAILTDLKRREHLAQLLKIKQEVATDKLPVLERIILRTVKNVERYESIVQSYLPCEIDLSDKKKGLELAEELKSVMSQYRLSYYLYLAFSFMRDEYKAWLAGKHDSETKSPNVLDVNDQIMKVVLFPDAASEFGKSHELYDDDEKFTHFDDETNFKVESGVLANEIGCLMHSGKGTARAMFVLADDGLMAYYLSDCNNVASINRTLETELCNEGAREVLESNEAIKKCEQFNALHSQIMKKGMGFTKWIVFYLIIGVLLGVGCWDLETVWLRWTLLIAGELFVLFRMAKKYVKCEKKYVEKLEYVNGKARDEMLLHAGNTPRMEKVSDEIGSVWAGALIGGFLGFLFIPVTGGLIIGGLIGAGLAALFGKDGLNKLDKALSED